MPSSATTDLWHGTVYSAGVPAMWKSWTICTLSMDISTMFISGSSYSLSIWNSRMPTTSGIWL